MIATGIGSLPTQEMLPALTMVFDRVPDLPFLPELPARGPAAGIIGRGASVLVDIDVDLQPSGWRVSEGWSGDQQAARDLLARDLDDLQIAALGYEGRLKVAVCGPWTFAACLERPRGGLLLADPGARRDLGQSLAAGLAELVDQVRAKVPGAQVVLQLDEPMLPMVLEGGVRTASGLERYRRVELAEVSDSLRDLRAVVDRAVEVESWVLHACAPGVPIEALYRVVDALALDLDTLARADWDALGPLLEAGRTFYLGAHPTRGGEVLSADAVAHRVLRVVRPLEVAGLEQSLVLTPACGLAGYAAPAAGRVLDAVRRAAEICTAELAPR